jgi:dTMP kinase
MWVTIEGVNGVGKTYLARAAAQRLGASCRLISELTDLPGGSLPGRVIEALRMGGGTFLRGGYPAAETLALLALKIHAYEDAPDAAHTARVVLEDRGVDTVAVYQAAIMAGRAAPLADVLTIADRVYATASAWRPPPDRTVLLIDDLQACIARYQSRTGPLFDADRLLLAQVADLYLAQASREPSRFTIIDRRGRSEAALVGDICHACGEAESGAVPWPA